MNSYDLKGQVAVITGGAQGIGLAVAERMVASGARVVLWDQDGAMAAESAAKLGHGTLAMQLDVTDAQACTDLAQKVVAECGQIDILVASAGVAGVNANVADYSVEEWHRVIAINLHGVFHSCRAVLPHMIARKYGRIVNIASIAGKEGNPTAGAYSASKAGVIGLTKSIGKETAGMDIAANCVTPAAAKTRIFDQITQAHIDFMLSKIPRGRFLEVAEAASMVTWLCTKENSFTTGAVFDLSGGRATY